MKRRFLFTTIPEKGHINPMIGPAVHLQQRGHDVTFFSLGPIEDQLRRVGITALPCPLTTDKNSDSLNRGAQFAANVRDAAWLRKWIKALLLDATPAQIPQFAQMIESFAPDVVVTDPMVYAAVIASHQAAKPWVALSNSLNPALDPNIRSDLLHTYTALESDRRSLFTKHGVDISFRCSDALSPRLTIAFTTKALIGQHVPGVELVGPSMPPDSRGDESTFDWSRITSDRPVIYLSFGSQIYYQPEIFRKVIAATQPLNIQLVIMGSELCRTNLLGPIPSHVLLSDYLPQLQLLPRTKVCITHGGANSFMEAIRFGVPMLISPVCNDQFHQAHYLAQRGIGRVLDLHTANIEQIRSTLSELLTDGPIRNAMQTISDSYQVDGAKIAADLIEQVK